VTKATPERLQQAKENQVSQAGSHGAGKPKKSITGLPNKHEPLKQSAALPQSTAGRPASTKRTRSALGSSTLKQRGQKLDRPSDLKLGEAAETRASPAGGAEKQAAAQEPRRLARRPQPSPTAGALSFSLVEHATNTLNSAVGQQSYSTGLTSTSEALCAQQEQQRKAFLKLFNLLMFYLGHSEPSLQA